MPLPNLPILPCGPCSSPPKGIAGHAHLRVQFLGGARMLFQCERCNRIWSRTGPQEGPFDWAATAFANTRKSSPGIAVPPRTNPATCYG